MVGFSGCLSGGFSGGGASGGVGLGPVLYACRQLSCQGADGTPMYTILDTGASVSLMVWPALESSTADRCKPKKTNTA